MKTAIFGLLILLGIALPALGEISPEEQRQRPAKDAALYQEIPESYRGRTGVFLVKEPTPTQSADTIFTYRLINLSEAPIYYSGYDAASPLIRLQERKSGKWREWQVIVDCGHGIGTSSLPPQKSVLIEVSSQQIVVNLSKGAESRRLTEDSRIGINILSSDENAHRNTIWSKP
jgi:hypothetical protein